MMIRRAVPGDEKQIAHVHVQSWKTTYKGIIKDEVLDNLSVERREQQWKLTIEEERIVYVAVNQENQIVGFANGGANRSPEYDYDGELFAIYILADYQRQGIGKQLIAHVAQELKRRGYRAMVVWVLDQNPALQAYQRLGAVPIGKQEIEIAGDRYPETCLVWEDIQQHW